MASKLKRFLKSDVKDGTIKLPKKFLFLRGLKYFSISEKQIDDKKKWYVEIPMSVYKFYLKKKESCKELSIENEHLKKENNELKEYAAKLEAANEQLMKNIENGEHVDNHKHNCTPIEKARKEGWKPTSDKSLDGHYPST